MWPDVAPPVKSTGLKKRAVSLLGLAITQDWNTAGLNQIAFYLGIPVSGKDAFIAFVGIEFRMDRKTA